MKFKEKVRGKYLWSILDSSFSLVICSHNTCFSISVPTYI